MPRFARAARGRPSGAGHSSPPPRVDELAALGSRELLVSRRIVAPAVVDDDSKVGPLEVVVPSASRNRAVARTGRSAMARSRRSLARARSTRTLAAMGSAWRPGPSRSKVGGSTVRSSAMISSCSAGAGSGRVVAEAQDRRRGAAQELAREVNIDARAAASARRTVARAATLEIE
jgi:hypothetical protein